jgi:hypothetical protein
MWRKMQWHADYGVPQRGEQGGIGAAAFDQLAKLATSSWLVYKPLLGIGLK